MNPTYTKLLVTAAAVGMYVLGHYLPDLKETLLPLAGGLAGGMWLPSPGTVKTPSPNDVAAVVLVPPVDKDQKKE